MNDEDADEEMNWRIKTELMLIQVVMTGTAIIIVCCGIWVVMFRAAKPGQPTRKPSAEMRRPALLYDRSLDYGEMTPLMVESPESSHWPEQNP